MIKRVLAAAAAAFLAGSLSASAQDTCGGLYTVQRGDSLSLIADKLYKDAGQWTVIYRSNIDRISSPDAIRVGQSYRLPCIGGLPTGLPGGTPLAEARAAALAAPEARPASVQQVAASRAAQSREAGQPARLLAGDDFRPFTNRLQMSSGLITDLLNHALVAAEVPGGHEFIWVNDRSVHLDPMLSRGMVDLAYPWKKPDCGGAPNAACDDYLYSEPMFEMLMVLFTEKGRPVNYNSVEDLAGIRVCSPLGYDTLARRGGSAGYLAKAGARLMQPVTAEECFARLTDGTADAVAMNEFTGRVVLKEMGLSNRVELMLRKPLSIEGLHVVAHKSNPRADQLIAAVNDGLAKIRESGDYLTVLDKHMSSIWAGLFIGFA